MNEMIKIIDLTVSNSSMISYFDWKEQITKLSYTLVPDQTIFKTFLADELINLSAIKTCAGFLTGPNFMLYEKEYSVKTYYVGTTLEEANANIFAFIGLFPDTYFYRIYQNYDHNTQALKLYTRMCAI